MSAVVWDTTLVSRLRPGVDLLDEVLRQDRRGEPIGIAAVSLLEISYGMSKAVYLGRPEFARLRSWFHDFVASGVARVFALGGDGALLAGEVRALLPTPPDGGRPRTRSKAEARVAWTHDIQIACAAWEAGHDIATVDVAHFAVIAECINSLIPGAASMNVVGPPGP
jgi:predicted nucleic acid-binding protein